MSSKNHEAKKIKMIREHLKKVSLDAKKFNFGGDVE